MLGVHTRSTTMWSTLGAYDFTRSTCPTVTVIGLSAAWNSPTKVAQACCIHTSISESQKEGVDTGYGFVRCSGIIYSDVNQGGQQRGITKEENKEG